MNRRSSTLILSCILLILIIIIAYVIGDERPEEAGLTYRAFEPINEKIPEKKKFTIITSGTRKHLDDLTQIHNICLRDYSKLHGYTYLFTDNYKSRDGLVLPVYWWKLQWALELLETTDCDYVVWLDNDTMICHREVRLEYIIEYSPQSSIFIGKDHPSDENCPYCAGVFFIKNNVIGKSFIRDCINGYLQNKECHDKDGKPSLNGAWAGICYEQGMMNKLIKTKYFKDTFHLPETILCNTVIPKTSVLILHLFGDKDYSTRIFKEFLSKKINFLPLEPVDKPPKVAIILTTYFGNNLAKINLYEKNVEKWLKQPSISVYLVDSSNRGSKNPSEKLKQFKFDQRDTLNYKNLTGLEKQSLQKIFNAFKELYTYDLVFKITGKYFISNFAELIRYIPRDSEVVVQNNTMSHGQNSEIFGARPDIFGQIVNLQIYTEKDFEKGLDSLVKDKEYKIYRLPPLVMDEKVERDSGDVLEFL